MNKPRLSRENLLPKLADHVLAHGLADASLRPLAKAAGTSDRMLIYHFGSKDALVADLLGHLGEMYKHALDQAMPPLRAKNRTDCAQRVIAMTRSPEFAPFLRLWWEIVAASAAGDAVYRQSAVAMLEDLLAWLTAQMPEDDPDPASGARLVFTLIEGTLMLDAVGQGSIGDAALNTLES